MLKHIYMVSQAGAMKPEHVDGAAEVLRSWGSEVTIAPHSKGRYGGLAGTVEERLADLQAAMDDPDSDTILCNRGGYGTIQLIDKLRINPDKLLMGFSDVTILHNAYGNIGRCSLHCQMAKEIATLGPQDESWVMLRKIVQGQRSISYAFDPHELNICGETDGLLMGGNLCVFTLMQGTPFAAPKDADILFIEDIHESTHYLDRYLQNLRISGVLSRLKAVIVGDFSTCENDTHNFIVSNEEMIRRNLEPLGIPVMFGFPAGHITHNMPLMMHARTHIAITPEAAIFEQEW